MMNEVNDAMEAEQTRLVNVEFKRGLTLYLHNDHKPKYFLYPANDSLIVRDDFDYENNYRLFRISYRHINMDKYIENAIDYRVFHSAFRESEEINFLSRQELLSYVSYWKKHFLSWFALMMDMDLNKVTFKRYRISDFVKITNYIAYDGNSYIGHGIIIKFFYTYEGKETSKRVFIPLFLSGMDVFHDNRALFDLDVILNLMVEIPDNNRVAFNKINTFKQQFTNKNVSFSLLKWI